jgi:hypothetical protein
MFIYLSQKHRIEVRFPISSKRGTTQQSFLRQSLLALEAEELIARGCWIYGPDLRYRATQPTQRMIGFKPWRKPGTFLMRLLQLQGQKSYVKMLVQKPSHQECARFSSCNRTLTGN